MILECPSCHANYEIGSDVPIGGRKVRCAKCAHVWLPQLAADGALPEMMPTAFSAPSLSPPRLDDAPDPAETTESDDDDAPGESACALDSGKVLVGGGLAGEEPAAKVDPGVDPGADTGGESPIGTREGEDTLPLSPGTPSPGTPSPKLLESGWRRSDVDRAPMRVRRGWGALAAVLVAVLAIVIFVPTAVVQVLPGAARLYSRFGVTANLRGLEFRNVTHHWAMRDGRPVIEVAGEIENVTLFAVPVPSVVFVLHDRDGLELYHWAIRTPRRSLAPGKRAAFTAHIPSPPKVVRVLQVRFAKAR